ncbi:ABC transporter permease subunit, partial [uncultured Aeromicrobium sp.]|uniref:ABC transporter permease subunit n=1 Tax=uncultured Aeromicrobium sp. TaxID=337820 RepID=UPI0025DB9259
PATGQPSATASALAALAVFFTTLVGATTAFRAADRAALDVVTVSGGGALARLRKVQLVSAVPGILAALRIAAPAALLGAIIGEYLGGVDRGLGPAMINAQQSLLFPRIWAIALVCSAVAGLAYAALGILARVFAPWAPAAEGSAR